METEIATPPVETIAFDPPIRVNPDVIAGEMIVTAAYVIPQDDPTQVVAAICGDGRVIGVPSNVNAEQSLRSALE